MQILIEPEIKSIDDLFYSAELKEVVSAKTQLRYLKIPLFQRSYDWDEDKIFRLLLDIESFVETGGAQDKEAKYFAGTILLEQSHNDLDTFEIIDGQQRLTSLFLIVFVGYLIARYRYIHLEHSKYSVKRFILESDRRINEFKIFESRLFLITDPNWLTDEVLKDDFVDYDKPDKQEKIYKRLGHSNQKFVKNYWDSVQPKLSQENKDIQSEFLKVLSQATIEEKDGKIYCRITDKASNYSKRIDNVITYLNANKFEDDKTFDESLGECISFISEIINNCGFCVITSKNRDDSFVLFEILNDRGRTLSAIDLIKNDILKNIPISFDLKKFENIWNELKANVDKAYGRKGTADTRFAEDIIRSEGEIRRDKYYSYLSCKEDDSLRNIRRDSLFKNEESENFLYRIADIAKIKSELADYKTPFSSGLQNGSAIKNMKMLDYIDYKWGEQIILGVNLLFRHFENEPYYKYSSGYYQPAWKQSDTEPSQHLAHFLRVLADILLKFGLIGMVCKLATKDLPTKSVDVLKLILNFVKSNKKKEDLPTLAQDIEQKLSAFIGSNTNDFIGRFKALDYSVSKDRKLMTLLLFLIYSHGKVEYDLENPSIEHLEPQLPIKNNQYYCIHDERDLLVNSIGNFILMRKDDNASLSNLPLYSKYEKLTSDERFIHNAYYLHPLIKHFYVFETGSNESHVNSGIHGQLPLLKTGEDFTLNFAPTKSFFDKRTEMYLSIVKRLILNHERFIFSYKRYYNY